MPKSTKSTTSADASQFLREGTCNSNIELSIIDFIFSSRSRLERPTKRRKFEASFKLKVIENAKNSNNCAAAREAGVTEKMIREWRKNEDVLRKMPQKKCSMRRGVTMWPELETEVENWAFDQLQKGYVVTPNLIRVYALKWAKLNPELSEDFKATAGWCSRFMDRKDLQKNIRDFQDVRLDIMKEPGSQNVQLDMKEPDSPEPEPDLDMTVEVKKEPVDCVEYRNKEVNLQSLPTSYNTLAPEISYVYKDAVSTSTQNISILKHQPTSIEEDSSDNLKTKTASNQEFLEVIVVKPEPVSYEDGSHTVITSSPHQDVTKVNYEPAYFEECLSNDLEMQRASNQEDQDITIVNHEPTYSEESSSDDLAMQHASNQEDTFVECVTSPNAQKASAFSSVLSFLNAKSTASSKYRQRMKENDPERYEEYLKKQRERAKHRRDEIRIELKKSQLSEEAKRRQEREKEKNRERQRRYIDRLKERAEENPAKKKKRTGPKLTVKLKSFDHTPGPSKSTRADKEKQREKWRTAKMKYRSTVSRHKKLIIKKKDRERKKQKRLMLSKRNMARLLAI